MGKARTVVWVVGVVACGLLLTGSGQAWSLASAGSSAWNENGAGDAWGIGGAPFVDSTDDRAADAGSNGSPFDLSIHIFKQQREMLLKRGEEVVRSFRVVLGRQPNGTKLIRGDNRTPEGRYYVCEKKATSRFHRFLGISYPNRFDADRAFADRLISANQWADIFYANLRRSAPPWDTVLGGYVGIHGHGGRRELPIDWTEGCIAVSDRDIDYLYDTVPVGTPVIISN